MDTRIEEIEHDTFRISTFVSDFGIQFNQFLIVDDQPFLMHTGFRGLFDSTRAVVKTVMDPTRLRWIGFSHFEADECGALNQWLEAAPQAQALSGQVGAMVNLSDYAIRPPRALQDNEVLDIGSHSIQYLSTPHFPHGWDAGLYFDQSLSTLFCSDLFFQPGDAPARVESDIVGPTKEAIIQNLAGPLAHDLPYTPYTDENFSRLASLNPKLLATMHGSSFAGNGKQALEDLSGVVKTVLGKPR